MKTFRAAVSLTLAFLLVSLQVLPAVGAGGFTLDLYAEDTYDPFTADTDGDGVKDIYDLDVDNDGILNIDEGYKPDPYIANTVLKAKEITEIEFNAIKNANGWTRHSAGANGNAIDSKVLTMNEEGGKTPVDLRIDVDAQASIQIYYDGKPYFYNDNGIENSDRTKLTGINDENQSGVMLRNLGWAFGVFAPTKSTHRHDKELRYKPIAISQKGDGTKDNPYRVLVEYYADIFTYGAYSSYEDIKFEVLYTYVKGQTVLRRDVRIVVPTIVGTLKPYEIRRPTLGGSEENNYGIYSTDGLKTFNVEGGTFDPSKSSYNFIGVSDGSDPKEGMIMGFLTVSKPQNWQADTYDDAISRAYANDYLSNTIKKSAKNMGYALQYEAFNWWKKNSSIFYTGYEIVTYKKYLNEDNEGSLDTDGDGIPDYRDPDSDTDRCFDAIEGDGKNIATQITADMLYDSGNYKGMIKGEVWSSGVVKSLGKESDYANSSTAKAQGIGSSRDSSKKSLKCPGMLPSITAKNHDDGAKVSITTPSGISGTQYVAVKYKDVNDKDVELRIKKTGENAYTLTNKLGAPVSGGIEFNSSTGLLQISDAGTYGADKGALVSAQVVDGTEKGPVKSINSAADAPDINIEQSNKITITPPKYKEAFKQIVVKYVDHNGTEKTTIVNDRDGVWQSTDANMAVDSASGVITFAAGKLKRGSAISAQVTNLDDIVGKLAQDVLYPHAPVAVATNTGGADVAPAPGHEGGTIEVSYTNASGGNSKVYIKYNNATGTWQSVDEDGTAKSLPANVTLDSSTGKLSFGVAAVKEKTSLSAKTIIENQAGAKKESETVSVQIKDVTAPAAPKITKSTQSDVNGVLIEMPTKNKDGSAITDLARMEIAGTGGSVFGPPKPAYATITKNNNGDWVSSNPLVEVNPTSGNVFIPIKYILEGSVLNAYAVDEAGNESDKTKYNVPDMTAPAAPIVKPNAADGSVLVKAADDDDTQKITVAYTDDSGNSKTIILKKVGETWKSVAEDGSDAQLPAGVSLLMNGDLIISNSAIKDGTQIKAKASDSSGNKSDESQATAPDITPPEKPTISQNQDASISVSPSQDSSKVNVKYTNSNGQEVSVSASKNESGTWVINPSVEGVAVDSNGTIKITNAKPGSLVQGEASDDSDNKVGAAIYTKPAAPTLTAFDKNSNPPSGFAKGDVMLTPPESAIEGTKINLSFTSQDGKVVNVYITKTAQGWVSSANTVSVVDGKIKIPDSLTKDGKDITALTATPLLDGKSVKSDAVNVSAPDVTDPPAPTLNANEDGSISVNPPQNSDDVTKIVVSYQNESGESKTVTASKNEQGKWSLDPSAESGVSIDEDTGEISIAKNAVKDNTTVSADSYDAAENTKSASVQSKANDDNAPKAPISKASNDNMTAIPVSGDSATDELHVSFTKKDDAQATKLVFVKNEAGTWSRQDSSDNTGTLDASTGEFSIPTSALKEGSDFNISAVNKVDGSEDVSTTGVTRTVPDITAPSKPSISTNDDGGASIGLPADAKVGDHVLVSGTASTGAPATALFTKTEDGWECNNPAFVVEGESATLPNNKVGVDTELSAYSYDAAGNTSETVKATLDDKKAPASPSISEGAADSENPGMIVVAPPTDNDVNSVSVTFTPEGATNPVTVTATLTDGNYVLSKDGGGDLPSGISVNPDTGKISIAEGAIKDGSDITAVAKDKSDNESTPLKKTSGFYKKPAELEMDARNDGSVSVTLPTDQNVEKIKISYKDKSGNLQNLEISKSDGAWTAPSPLKIVDGKVLVPYTDLNANTEITATPVYNASLGNVEGNPSKIKSKTPTAPSRPLISTDDSGDVVIELVNAATSADADLKKTKKAQFFYTNQAGVKESAVAELGSEGWQLKAAPGSTINTDYVSVNKETGKITIKSAGIKNNTKVSAHSINANNIESPTVEIESVDKTKPSSPNISTPADGSVLIKPAADDSAKMTINYGDNKTATVEKDPATGKWNIVGNNTDIKLDADTGEVLIPADAANAKAVSVTASDSADNASEAANATAKQKDTTPPDTPEINQIHVGDTSISGTGEPGATLNLVLPDKSVRTVKVSVSGEWTIDDVPAIKAGDTVKARLVDAAGNESAETTMKRPEELEVNEVKQSHNTISGKGEPGAKIEITIGDKTISTVVDEQGEFSVGNLNLADSAKITVKQTDPTSGETDTKQIEVSDNIAPSKPGINTPVSGATEISGVGEKGATVTLVLKDGSKKTTTVGEDGTWKIENLSPIVDGDTFTVSQKDESGNTSESVSSTLVDNMPPAAPSIDTSSSNAIVVSPPSKNKDGSPLTDLKSYQIEGTNHYGSPTTVTLSKGEDGKWKSNSSNVSVDEATGEVSLSYDKLFPSSELKVFATDISQNKSETKTIKVKDTVAPISPKMNADSTSGTVSIEIPKQSEVQVGVSGGNPVYANDVQYAQLAGDIAKIEFEFTDVDGKEHKLYAEKSASAELGL